MTHVSGSEDHPGRANSSLGGGGALPTPQPEQGEPRLGAPVSLRRLSARDYRAIIVRAVKETMADQLLNVSKAVAYGLFFSIPSALLVALGVFGLVASPTTIQSTMNSLRGVVPSSVIGLVQTDLAQVTKSHSGSLGLLVVGLILALWSLTGAMTTLMWGLNTAYERTETRNFVKQRLYALGMVVCCLAAFGLAFVLLVLGPFMTNWVGHLVGNTTIVAWVWWTVQWPVLIAALLVIFAVILYLGPNVEPPRFQLITPGATTTTLLWLAASGAFAIYTAGFAHYNKAWGSLSAVIVMLTWLWLTSLAILVGAEINAETERSHELRQGKPAQTTLTLPTRT